MVNTFSHHMATAAQLVPQTRLNMIRLRQQQEMLSTLLAAQDGRPDLHVRLCMPPLARQQIGSVMLAKPSIPSHLSFVTLALMASCFRQTRSCLADRKCGLDGSTWLPIYRLNREILCSLVLSFQLQFVLRHLPNINDNPMLTGDNFFRSEIPESQVLLCDFLSP